MRSGDKTMRTREKAAAPAGASWEREGESMYNPQLETFLCVAESGSFNKAAEKLYISPPAVIKQINLLEESLNLQLFVRTHRGLKLTEAGKSLCQDAKYIIQYCKDSVTRARNAMQQTEQVIRIGTSPMTPAQVLVDLWPKVQKYCPNIKFQLIPFDNTPENAREILGNLGANIPGADLLRGFDSPPAGPERLADGPGPLRAESDADAPGLEPLCRLDAGRPLEEPPADPYCRFRFLRRIGL